MRRTTSALAIALTVLALTAATVLAEINWKSGPTFTGPDANGVFTATGEATGLGNKPATAQIVLTGTVRYTCQNGGGNESPGQNPVPATTASPVQDLGNSDHNGRGVLNVSAGPLTAAATIGGKVAGCPNKNWTGINPVFEGGKTATLTITQGKTVLYTQTINY